MLILTAIQQAVNLGGGFEASCRVDQHHCSADTSSCGRRRLLFARVSRSKKMLIDLFFVPVCLTQLILKDFYIIQIKFFIEEIVSNINSVQRMRQERPEISHHQ
jgi:hypothetical protein